MLTYNVYTYSICYVHLHVLQLREVLRARVLLLGIVSEHVPAVGDLRRVALPQLREDDGPEAHEQGEHHRRLVVEEILGLGHHAGVPQRPELAELVADWTHGHVCHRS